MLGEALIQLRHKGAFESKNVNLEALMRGSRSTLSWVNYPLVDEGRQRRNDVAHRQSVLPESDCYRFIDAVEAELLSWRIIPHRVRGSYTITVTPSK